MNGQRRNAALGVAAAIAITTAMDAGGLSVFSALPLVPLAAAFALFAGMSPEELGFVRGTVGDHARALAYPAVVPGLVALAAFIGGAVDTGGADWKRAALNMALMATTGVVMVLLTEEGFFRGWLWAALRRGGQTDGRVLLWTTLAFVLWHVSAVSLATGFDLPADRIPVYLCNAALIGAAFGILRMTSRSVIVPSVCHAVWNAIVYPLFGFGEQNGALGIANTAVFGPEVGILGVAFNALFMAALWRWARGNPRGMTAA